MSTVTGKNEKTGKKHKYTLRAQFTVIFFLLMLGAIGITWLIDNTFLEQYYIRVKERALTEFYEKIDEAKTEGILQTEEFAAEISKSIYKDNIDYLVMDADSESIIGAATDKQTIEARFYQNVFGSTPYLKDRTQSSGNGETSASSGDAQGSAYSSGNGAVFYIMADLVQNDNYTIRTIYDTRTGTRSMELFSILSDKSYILCRTTLESIRNSSAIANRFMGYVGLIVALFGALVALFLAGRLTKPIRELTAISARMKELDFSAKYTGRSRTEIAELGENINELSQTLEKTISELKTANNELREDIERKQKAEDMRQEFLSGVTHELKTPLALIQGYAEGLQDGIADDPESAKFYTDVIIDEAGKMNKMVIKLLSLNQLEFGDTEVNFVRFDIVGFIEGALQSERMLAVKNGIRVTMDRHEPIYVWADEFLTEEVFTNYFSNAVNHCEGEKVIDIRFEEKQNCVRITVFNTGKQIPEESMPRLWEKFYKVDKARTRAYGGSGVGLSIVRAIMDLMHQEYGAVNYENGVAFWFELETRAGS